jgi:ArsR family transcriptional regulator
MLEIDQSSVSRQLAVLRTRNIVEDRKEGTTVYYRVRDPAVFQLLDIAREIFNNQLIDTHAMLQQLADEEIT